MQETGQESNVYEKLHILPLESKLMFIYCGWELSTWQADNNGFMIGSSKTKANRQRTEVIAQLSRRS